MPESPANRELLKYFMDETNRRFDKLDQTHALISEKLDGLQAFKERTLTHTRWMAAVISGIVSLGGFGLSIGVELYLQRQERAALLDAARLEQARDHAAAPKLQPSSGESS